MRYSPKRERVIDHIRQCCCQARQGGQSRLPSVRKIAESTGVAVRTVVSAMHVLADRGEIEIVPGGGAFPRGVARSSSPPAEPVPHTQARWVIVRNGILEHIRQGNAWAHPQLLQIKELRNRFAANYYTVKKALQSLEADGIIEQLGRGYRTTSTPSLRTNSRIGIISITRNSLTLSTATPRSQEWWRMLELMCQQRSVVGTLCTTEEALGRAKRDGSESYSLEVLEKRYAMLGYVILVLGIGRRDMGLLLRRIAALGKPVALLDERRWEHVPGNLRKYRYARLFDMGAARLGGSQIGRYLWEMGHRALAYFAPSRGDAIAELRCRALVEQFEKRNCPVHVSRYYPDTPNGADMHEEPAASSPIHQKARRIEADYAAVDKDSDDAFVDKDLQEKIRSSIASLSELKALGIVLRPVFARALERKATTAWVCYSDQIAYLALHFLKTHGVRVPGQISVVGFDDRVDSFGLELTSYNFNVPGVVSAMLEHIIAPPQSRDQKPTTVEVPGMLMVRSTSGPARES